MIINTIINDLGLVKDFANARVWFGKRWFLSKTLWVNAVAIAAMLLQHQYGLVIDVEEQMAILAVINIIVRLVTSQPLVLRESDIINMTEAGKDEQHNIN